MVVAKPSMPRYLAQALEMEVGQRRRRRKGWRRGISRNGAAWKVEAWVKEALVPALT
jgi:hypothetical protein